jgi:aminopeptidase N
VEEVVSNTSNATTCEITLRNIQEEQFGTWRCKIIQTLSALYQEAHFTVTTSGTSANVRLPKHLSPKQYEIYLTPFIEVGNFSIEGREKIHIHVIEDGSKNITLHSEKIKLYENTIKVIRGNKTELKIEGFGYDKEKAFFIIYLKENLQAGENITLSMSFLGDLNDELTGFYRSDYLDEENNVTEYMATTQFEIDGARRAMPCFDEPSFKAKFLVNLGRIKDMTSISNMPLKSKGVKMQDNDIYVWDNFETSPVMSTYLLAFVISRMVYQEGVTRSNGVEFKVWSRIAVSDQTNIAAEVGPLILELYERHYDVPYPLPKMDLVAVPDFSAGAMENWGLITFRETALLFKDGESGISDREKIVTTIAHELAHQWFGNLVTMEWWTE